MSQVLMTESLVDQRKESFFGIRRQWLELIKLLVMRDLRVRYRNSFLGYMWSMLNPLLYMLILTLVFSRIVRVQTQNYALFILIGIMTWNFLHQSVIIGMNSIVGSGHLLKKVNIPPLLFPTSSVCGVLINFLLSFVPFVVISLLMNHPLTGTMLLVVPFLVIYFGFVWGMTCIIATINVRYRDVGHAMESLMQMLFYATPVVYSVDVLPEKYRMILQFNPVSSYIAVVRKLLIENTLPSLS